MKGTFQAVQITDRVYWVGAIDWNLREFHGYATPRGTTYNAFLVLADKVTLIDTVKAPFFDEMLGRIASVIAPSDIAYVVSNHSEMDHSGSLPRLIEAANPEDVFASAQGVKALEAHFHTDGSVRAVKDGERVSLGDVELTFIETRMLHWPDSMFTLMADEGVLFSQDAFGMHLASSELFADRLDQSLLEFEAGKYYANILMPLSNLVKKLLGKLAGALGDVKMILPDHGPIWREDVSWIVDRYAKWAERKPTKKALVVYDTMWESTDMMARAIADGLMAGGAKPTLMRAARAHRSDIATELLDAGALIVGSPTVNNTIFPGMADVMTYVKGLRPQNLIGTAFGSYGWSGEAVRQLTDMLAEMKVDVVGDGVKCQYVPDGHALAACRSLGIHIAERLDTICGNRPQ